MPEPRPEAELSDQVLVGRAQAGDRAALEELVRRYQSWIYNVAIRMVWQPEEAEDVTQEVIIKLLTKLSGFRGDSSLRTWIYRITANHVLNMKKRGSELRITSFEEYGQRINACPDDVLPDPKTVPVDPAVLEGESKLACITGMLLCLDREQQLAFILGAIFGLDSGTAAEVLEITPENYRQRLSRARRDLKSFMSGQCGLVNSDNPCRCAKKTKAYIQFGVVDPDNLRFTHQHLKTLAAVAGKKKQEMENWLEPFRQQPFYDGPNLVTSVQSVQSVLEGAGFLDITGSNPRKPD